MAKCLCDKATGLPGPYSRLGDIDHNPTTHVVITVDHNPDPRTERLNATQNGLRAATAAERTAYDDDEKDKEADPGKIDSWLKAFALALNDGTFVPGSNYTPAQIKQIVKDKM